MPSFSPSAASASTGSPSRVWINLPSPAASTRSSSPGWMPAAFAADWAIVAWCLEETG